MAMKGSGTGRIVVETEVEVHGHVLAVTYARVFDWDYDPRAGSDADGNRGMPLTAFYDEDPEAVLVCDQDGDGEERPIEALPAAFGMAVLRAIEARHRTVAPDEEQRMRPED